MKPTRVMQWRHGVSGCGLHKHLALSHIALTYMSWH